MSHPIAEDTYRMLARGKIAALAKPDSDQPRPAVVVDALRRIGMATLLKICKEELGTYFGKKSEYGVGVTAPSQKIAWGLKMCQEEEPTSIQFWSDLSNGFNQIQRQAVEEGLQNLPTSLQWLRRAFRAFYSGKVELSMVQRQGGAETVVDIISEGGVFQGDSASGVYFNAGLQNAFDKLRQEYPQATLVKYLDDLNGSVKGNETVNTNEPRAKAKPDTYKNEEQSREVTTVPMATAILFRWEYLTLSMCGLEASPKKRGVCSLQSTLTTEDYYGIPITDGLKVGGIPIGKDKYVITEIAKILTETVAKVYQATDKLGKSQYRHLLNVNCGGTIRVQHLWQTVRPSLTEKAISTVDILTAEAIKTLLGKTELSEEVIAQSFMPVRFGGLGYRSSDSIADAAYIGGFALASFGIGGIGDIKPELRQVIEQPENHRSQFPSLQDLYHAWNMAILDSDRLQTICKGAITGVLNEPRPENENLTEDEWSRAMANDREKEHAKYEIMWKQEFIQGRENMKGKTAKDTAKIKERATESWNDNQYSTLEQKQYNTPQSHPSILHCLWKTGERKIQKLIARLSDMERAIQFIAYEGRSDNNKARLRGTFNTFANIPLRVTPSREERKFNNAEFEWILCNRLRIQQPTAKAMTFQTCKCGCKIEDGRHFRKCPINNGLMRVHDTMRDTCITMMRSAGLTVLREPQGLLQDNNTDRPADAFIKNWPIEISKYTDHAIDFSFPLVDSTGIESTSKHRICLEVGIVANQKATSKSNNIGSKQDQEKRGNDRSMKKRCELQGINYWPVPVEGDGQTSANFEAFLKNVSDAASELRNPGHDSSSFKRKWKILLACKLAKKSAQIAISRAINEYRRIAKVTAPDDELSLQSHMLVPDIVGANRSYRNWYSANYRKFTIRKSSMAKIRGQH